MVATLAAASAQARDVILGAGIGTDDSGGQSIAALVDVELTEATYVTVSGGYSEADTLIDAIATRSFDLALSHNFDPISVRLEAGIWGDSDLVESDDIRANIAFSNKRLRIGLDAERRDIDFQFTLDPIGALPGVSREVALKADGLGASLRLRNDGWSAFVRGVRYDYDRDLDQFVLLERLRRLQPTTLTLAGALRDDTIAAGVEFELGEHLLGVDYTRDTLAIGDIRVDSISLIWTAPASQRSDLELSLGYSEAEDGDGAVFLNAFLYFFAGS